MTEFSPTTLNDIPVLVELWNGAFGPQWPMTEQLMRQTLAHDPYFEPEGSLAALDGGRIVGWVLCKSMRPAGPEMGRFQKRGGIGALCVHPEFQRRGIASQLLDRAEAHLRANESKITTLYFPHHFLPGIPEDSEAAVALFKKRGYTGSGIASDLWRELADYELPEKVEVALKRNPTVEVRPGRPEEADAIIAMISREFPGGWTYSTKRHFQGGGLASDIIVVAEGTEIIGFCHTADWNSKWLLPNVYWHKLLGERYGGLGPLGMASEHRKRGLGLAVTAMAVADLKRRGVERMAIDWTGLVTFYELLGFRVWKRYLQMELQN